MKCINGKQSGKSAKKLSRFRNQHIGFVFQFHHLLPEFTAHENVCIPAFIEKVPRHDAEKKAKEFWNFLGMGHRLNTNPQSFPAVSSNVLLSPVH